MPPHSPSPSTPCQACRTKSTVVKHLLVTLSDGIEPQTREPEEYFNRIPAILFEISGDDILLIARVSNLTAWEVRGVWLRKYVITCFFALSLYLSLPISINTACFVQLRPALPRDCNDFLFFIWRIPGVVPR
jgi:hypothetical protein